MNAYDKRGIPIHPGDTLKVFHYVARQRREKRYMYKHVVSLERGERVDLLKISHLSFSAGHYFILAGDQVLPDYEIVQGFGGVERGKDYRDRPRKKNHVNRINRKHHVNMI